MMTLPCGEFKMFQHVKTYLKLRAQTAAEIFKSSGAYHKRALHLGDLADLG